MVPKPFSRDWRVEFGNEGRPALHTGHLQGVAHLQARVAFFLQHLSPASAASWKPCFLSSRLMPHRMHSPESQACLGLGWSLHMAAFLHPQLERRRGQNISTGVPNELLRNCLDFKHSNPWSPAWTSEAPSAWDSEPLQKSQHCSQSSLGCVFVLHFSASTKMERPRRHYHL